MTHAGRTAMFGVLAALPLIAGCAERRIFITSDPSGARVFLNEIEVGYTPVEVDFTYFGVYDVRLRKEGFEPLITTAEAEAPLHEQPGFDLIAGAIPGKDTTHIRWHFELEPSKNDVPALIDRGLELRERMSEPETEAADDAQAESAERPEVTSAP